MNVTSRAVSGLLVRGPLGPDHEAILTPDALDFVASLVRDFAGRRDELLERRRDRQLRFDAGERPHFLPETRAVRESSWTVAPLPADLQDRRVEITGPVERKMVINALNSGARVFMADFEDSNSPTWDNVVLGHQHLVDAVRRTIRVQGSGHRQGVPPRREARRPPRPAARPAPAGEARRARREADPRLPLRLRPLLLPQRAGAAGAGHRALLLPAQAAVPPRGAAVERRLRGRAGEALHPARDDQGHRAHRDAPRRLRDGRDPLGAARALLRPQLRALGLHLQPHQDAARRPALGDPRPGAGHDDPAQHAGLHPAPHQDLPPARGPRDGRHGRADPDQGRPAGERGGPRQGARGQAARGAGRARRHLGGPPRPRAGGPRDLRRAHEDPEPDPREA